MFTPTAEVRLPVGHVDDHGRVRRAARLRKLRGHEEALLYQPGLSPADLVSQLIHGCLAGLDEWDAPALDVAEQLTTADRNFLLLEARRLTLGDAMRASYRCPACGHTQVVTENLAALPVRWLADDERPSDATITLSDGYQDRDGVRHHEVVLTLPRGADERFVAATWLRDPLAARDALVLRCIRRFGSLPRAALDAYGLRVLRDLTLADRAALYRALEDGAPGVDFRRAVACEACGHAFSAALDVSDFFVVSWEGTPA